MTTCPDYRIAIPSYHRHKILRSATLATVARMGASPGRITVFVADSSECDVYRRELPEDIRVEVGVPGLAAQRQFYNAYYPKDTPLLNLDDDIHDVLTFTPDGKKLMPAPYRLDDVVGHAFGVCEEHGARLWGICAAQNPFYMGKTTSVGLRFACGIFHGSYAGDRAVSGASRPVVSSGEDYETTLRSFSANGAVVRLDWICAKTTFFAPGGMQDELGGKEERNEDNTRELHAIARRHPGLCSIYMKAGGITNLRLARFPVTHVTPPAFTGLPGL